MNQAEIEALLMDVVCSVQSMSGRTAGSVSTGTKPCTDLDEFDSLNGVEATIEALDRLKTEIDINNIFVEDGEALTVSQAATRLLSCMNKKAK